MGLKTQNQKHTLNLKAVKNKISSRLPIPVYYFLPYKDILNRKGSPILLKDDTYADLLNLPGKDLDFLDAEGANSSKSIIADFHTLLSTYLESFDIKIIQLPADTRVQQATWGKELIKVEAQMSEDSLDERHYNQLLQMRQTILREISLEKDVVSDITHQEYTAVIYGNTLTALEKTRRDFIASAGSAFTPEPVTLERKKMVLYKINNPGETLELEGK